MTSPLGRARIVRAALASVCALALLAGAAGTRIGPAQAQEAPSAVQDVTLQDVSLPFGATVLIAPRLTASGTRLSKDELAAILRANSPEPWAQRLARLDAASLTIPELRSEHAGPGPARQSVVYRDVTARDVRAGKVAELTAAGAAITVSGGSESGSSTYGRVRATELDLAALARLYGVPGDGKGPIQRVYATVGMADIVYSDDRGTTVKVAGIEGRDLGGRQIPGGWSGALGSFSGVPLDRASPEERARITGAAADLAEAVSVGGLEAKGLAVSDTRGKAPFVFEIARLAFAGAGDEPGARLEDIAFAQGGVRTRIGRLTLAGFSLAPTVATLRRLAAPDAAVSEADLRRLTPVIGTLALQDMSLELPPADLPKEVAKEAAKDPAKDPGKDVGAEFARPPAAGGAARDPLADAARRAARPPEAIKPEASRPPGAVKPPEAAKPAEPVRVALRSASVSFGTPRDGVPTASRIALTGLTLPAATVAGVPGLGSLDAYGYRDLDLNVAAETRWDEASRELAVQEFSVSGKDMGTLRLAGTLGGIGPEVFDPDAATSGLAMLSATAKALDLTIENAGLFERFIAAQSKVLSLKPDELRQEYVTASMLGVPVILGNSPAAKAIGTAMGQFVTKPGRLSLSAKAKDGTGLGVAEFSTAGNPGAVLDKLDVDAKAN